MGSDIQQSLFTVKHILPSIFTDEHKKKSNSWFYRGIGAVELIKNWVKCRLVKLPIIIDPATYYRIKHAGQIFNRLVGHSVNPPTSHCSAHGTSCLIAHGWKKTHKEFSITIFRSTGAKRVPQKIEFLVWIPFLNESLQ